MNTQKVYVIILNFNRGKLTIDCLKSVLGSDYPYFDIILIDNGSTNNSKSEIIHWLNTNKINWEIAKKINNYSSSVVKLILLEKNYGYSGGNNVGITIALNDSNCKYIWLLNNDTIVEKNSMLSLVECIEKNKYVGMAGSKLVYMDKKDILQCAGGCKYNPLIGNSSFYLGNRKINSYLAKKNAFLDYICGASLMVKREVIEKIGLLDESFFLYWEDAEWGIRAKKNGYKLMYCPNSIVYHKEGGTAGRINFVNDYYWTRNGLYLTKKFYPFFLPVVLFSYFFKYIFVRTLRKEKLNLKSYIVGILDFLKGKKGQYNHKGKNFYE